MYRTKVWLVVYWWWDTCASIWWLEHLNPIRALQFSVLIYVSRSSPTWPSLRTLRQPSRDMCVYTQVQVRIYCKKFIVKSLNFKLLLLLITSIFCYVCIICYIYFVTEVYTYVCVEYLYILPLYVHTCTGNIFGQLYIHVSKQLTINNLYLWGLFNPGKWLIF